MLANVRRAGRLIRRVVRAIGRRMPWHRPVIDRWKPMRALDGPHLIDMPLLKADPTAAGPPRLTVLLPTLQMEKMTGGVNTALNLTARLAGHGFALRFVATFGDADEDVAPIRAHIEDLTGEPLRGDIEFARASREIPLSVRPNDIFVATWWPTAHVANAALSMTRASEFIYLVQDFEPGFYPWSTDYALALESYDFPARVVFNESLLATHFRASGIGVFADPGRERKWISFEPAVDRTLFKRASSGGSNAAGRPRRRLAFYARPKRKRNCFELGLRALRLAAQEGLFHPDEWEIVSFGARIPEFHLSPRQIMRRAPWMSYADYARYLGETDILLSLMLSPHTSYPPLEMATAGGVVVTNTFGVKTEAALQAVSPRILASLPDASALASCLRRASELVAAGSLEAAHPADVALPATWGDAFAEVVPWLTAAVGELSEAP